MEKQDAWHHAWNDVDRTTDPGFFVRFLDATRAGWLYVARANPRQFFAYLNVEEGHHILDVGCGTGDLLQPLAQLVGGTGRVVGMDYSETMIAEARKRADGKNLPPEFRTGDIRQLDLPDNMFDRCLATAIFQHLDEPRKALAELVRVARPGALVVVTEHDWETLVVDARDRDVTRRISHFFCDSIRNGWVAHQLPGLFKEAGLTDFSVVGFAISMMADYAIMGLEWLRDVAERAVKTGVVSEAEAAGWLSDLEERGGQGRFFAAFTMFRIAGRKA